MSKRLDDAFINLPAPFVPKSYHNLSHSLVTSMKVGYLYPIDWQEVLPGDVFRVKNTHVSKVTSSFIRPVMDNLYIDTYSFYVPYTQVYTDAKNVFGDPSPSSWTEEKLADMPMLSSSALSLNGGIASGSVGDYLGLPLGSFGTEISVLPFRTFAHIYNEWFRNENINDEVLINKGSTILSSEVPNKSAWSAKNYAGMPPQVPKYKDYFTSALPNPQKGDSIRIATTDTSLPVYTTSIPNSYYSTVSTGTSTPTYAPLLFGSKNSLSSSGNYHDLKLYSMGQQTTTTGAYTYQVLRSGATASSSTSESTANALTPLNLVASGSGGLIDINDLRFAEAYQHDLELNAMYGTRYDEYLLSHFGVYSDELEIGKPKYLGGARTPVSIMQVEQTSDQVSESESGQLGRLGAYSWSVGRDGFKYRCKYHGIIMTVACLRYKHTYQQGIQAKWRRKTREDFYNPSFAYIGMQPIYQSEIYATASDNSNVVFGYKPAWNEYRFNFNQVTGEARSGVTNSDGVNNSLDYWHFADDYSSAPTLSEQFINEDAAGFSRTVSVSPDSQDSFIFSFYFDILARRPITEYSEPSINVKRW